MISIAARSREPRSKDQEKGLRRRATPASRAGRPELPGLAAPAVDCLSTGEVSIRITRRLSATAGVPVIIIYLPESDVVSTAGVLIHSICVSTGLMAHNALAVSLIPGVLGAPCSDILHALCGATRACSAITTGTVATAVASRNGRVVGHFERV